MQPPRRLVGLETEYAPRLEAYDADGDFPTNDRAFRLFVAALRRRIPMARAAGMKPGFFLATGGAVWQESSIGQGYYIEGSTPECYGARQLLAWQRAQDRLFSEAASRCAAFRRFTLIKNDRDSVGHTYGAQENYEAVIAAGWRLAAWRIGLIAMLPLLLATWLVWLALLLALFCYLLAAGAFYLCLHAFVNDPTSLGVSLFGKKIMGVDRSDSPSTPWVEQAIIVAEIVSNTPLLAAVLLLARLFAFRQTRRRLLPFLVSRAVVCGAGHLDANDCFWLSDKAPGIKSTIGLGAVIAPHPIFTFGHILKAMAFGIWSDRREFFRLFRRRQRLQIAIGDSNMAETAEYLRIGATLLVIDAIEAGYAPSLAPLRRPVAALKTLTRDASLTAPIQLGAKRLTALEIQRSYWECCGRFLAETDAAMDEAADVHALWGDVLDRLQRDPDSLIGDIDWITKRFLLLEVGAGATLEARRKIDLRYHELSDDGYYRRFAKTGFPTRILSESEIEQACAAPPPLGPARRRGTLIRRLAKQRKKLRVSWNYIKLGCCAGVRMIRLDRAARPRRAVSRST